MITKTNRKTDFSEKQNTPYAFSGAKVTDWKQLSLEIHEKELGNEPLAHHVHLPRFHWSFIRRFIPMF